MGNRDERAPRFPRHAPQSGPFVTASSSCSRDRSSSSSSLRASSSSQPSTPPFDFPTSSSFSSRAPEGSSSFPLPSSSWQAWALLSVFSDCRSVGRIPRRRRWSRTATASAGAHDGGHVFGHASSHSAGWERDRHHRGQLRQRRPTLHRASSRAPSAGRRSAPRPAPGASTRPGESPARGSASHPERADRAPPEAPAVARSHRETADLSCSARAFRPAAADRTRNRRPGTEADRHRREPSAGSDRRA
jgi:hypothetical protein